MTAIIILAAGASSRMGGRDKLLEDVDGIPLVRRQALRAVATGAPVLITLPAGPHPRYDAFEGLEVQTVPVPDAADGMSASLRAGLRALPAGTKAAMIVLADMPEITTEDMNTVLRAVDPAAPQRIWRAQTQDGKPGHPTAFHAALFAQLLALRGDHGAAEVIKAHAAQVQAVPLPANHARTDLDTPADWAAWRARITSPE